MVFPKKKAVGIQLAGSGFPSTEPRPWCNPTRSIIQPLSHCFLMAPAVLIKCTKCPGSKACSVSPRVHTPKGKGRQGAESVLSGRNKQVPDFHVTCKHALHFI